MEFEKNTMVNSGAVYVLYPDVIKNHNVEVIVQNISVLKAVVYEVAHQIFQG